MEKVKNHQIKVLLIDDNEVFAGLVVQGLANFGHTCESLAGVSSFTDGILNGIGYDGKPKPINLTEHRFFVALVDGDLGESSKRGVQIVPFLREHEIPCIGISASPEEGEVLKQAGCFNAILKGVIDWIFPDIRQIVEIGRGRDRRWD